MRWAVLVTRGVGGRAGPAQEGSVSKQTDAGVSVVSAWIFSTGGAQALTKVGLDQG